MEIAKFHPAVELVLSRMESNPQEFTYEGGKWRHTIEQHTRWMSKEEKDAVNEKLRIINLDNLRTTMLKKIVTDKPKYENGYEVIELGTSISSSAQPTWATLSLGHETLSANDLQDLKEMMEEYKDKGAY